MDDSGNKCNYVREGVLASFVCVCVGARASSRDEPNEANHNKQTEANQMD